MLPTQKSLPSATCIFKIPAIFFFAHERGVLYIYVVISTWCGSYIGLYMYVYMFLCYVMKRVDLYIVLLYVCECM